MKSFMARRVVLAAVLLGGATVVGVALAGQALTHKTHAASDVIRTCVKQEGQLRVVGSETDCKQNESPLAWNIQGPQGIPGVSVTTAPLAAGDAHCATGGLQVSAASGVSYVCNGADGKNGTNGANGKDGKDGVSVTTTSLAAGDATCPTGGVKVTSAAGDTFVCNGATGAPGQPGAAGTGTLSSPNGVFKIEITDQGIFLRGPSKTLFLNRYSSGVGPTTSR